MGCVSSSQERRQHQENNPQHAKLFKQFGGEKETPLQKLGLNNKQM